MKPYKPICLLLILGLLLSVVSCGSENETQTLKKTEYVLTYSDTDVLSNEEYNNIESFINTVYADFLHVDLVTYDQGPETFDKCMQVGIRGIPVIVDRLKFIENNRDLANDLWFEKCFYGLAAGSSHYARFLALCSRGITRSVKYFCMCDESLHGKDDGTATTYYCFLKYAKEKIPEITKSDVEIHKKLKSLSVFGIYALPYVLAEIENGNVEYEEYFIYIGLHISDSEYMKIADENYVSSINSIEHFDSCQKDFDRHISKLLSTGEPNTFNYKKWLQENEDDLNILFKYIDDFCVEYEAENK